MRDDTCLAKGLRDDQVSNGGPNQLLNAPTSPATWDSQPFLHVVVL